MSNQVCLRTFDDPASAELARERLEAAGIQVRVVGAKLVNPWAYGGIQLFVPADAITESETLLGPDHALEQDPADDDDPGPRCPRCESAYVVKRWSTPQLVIGVALGVWPLLFMKKSAVFCQTCEFRGDEGELVPRNDKADYRSLRRREGNPVFRLRRSNLLAGIFVGLVGAALLSAINRAGALYIMALGPVAGAFFAHALRRDVCSKPGCRAYLPKDATHCPKCEGKIAGVITSASEHFARKAAWHRHDESLDHG